MTIFWNCQDVLLPRNTTINGSFHTSLLHQFHSSIWEKRAGGVLFLHDNVHVYKFNSALTAIQYTSFTEFNHPAYSPDIAPSNYHLFLNLKNFLRCRNFELDNDHESLFGES